MLHITRSIVQGAGLGTFIFLIYILELKPICNFNVLMISRSSALNTLPLILQRSLDTLLDWQKLVSLSLIAPN